MKTRNKKGFTIIELVIVIAVIGILTAILVPVFINLANKANRASDDSLVKNLNTAMAMEEGEGKTNNTYHDAIQYLDNYGFKLENLATKSEYSLLWNSKTNRFLLNEESAFNKDQTETRAADHQYWTIQNSIPDTPKYSVYAGLGWNEANPVVVDGIGFDAGNHAITSISYNGASQNVVIRTNSVLTDLNINAVNDTVNHYGEVGKVDIAKIDMNCYNEYGNAKYVKVTEGKVVAKANGTISIAFADNTNGAKVAVIKETNGNIDNGYTRVEDVDTTNRARTDGIPLTYAMYVDETTVITGDNFADYIETTANYVVETAREAEKASQAEPQLLPTGKFADPFEIEDAAFGDLIIVYGNSYDGSYSMFGNDPFVTNDHFEEVWDDIGGLFEDFEITWYFDGNPELTESDIVSIEIDEMAGACVETTDIGSVDVTFVYIDDNEEVEIGTVTIAVTGEIPEEDDGSEVYALNDVTQDIDTSNTYINLTNIENGSTLKLLRNYSGKVEFYASNNKSITFDLNGYSIKDLKFKDITVTIIDSSVDKTGKIETLTFTCWYGLENPNFVFNAWTDDVARNDYHEGEGYEYLEFWVERPAKLTLISGSIKTLHLQDCGEVVIAGASIINTDPVTYTTGHVIHIGVQFQYLSISIKSGIVVGEKDFRDAGKVSISGGYFSEQVPTQYLATGCTCVQFAEGIYQVVSK